MHKKKLAAIAAVLAGCATPPPAPPIDRPTLDDYKRIVAQRIAAASGDTYSEPVPEMLKSIVVLEITLGPNLQALLHGDRSFHVPDFPPEEWSASASEDEESAP